MDEKEMMDISRFFATPDEFTIISTPKSIEKIEINLSKLERGTHEGQVKVVRDGKTFYRKQRLGTKEKEGEVKSKKDDLTIVGLNKPTEEESEPEPKPEVESKPKSEMITGSMKDGSLNKKERKEASENLMAFLNDLEEKEGKIENKYDSVRHAGKVYTMGYSWDLNAYLLSDRKKGFDFMESGLKDIDDEEKGILDNSVELLDKFLSKAPKVKTTTYRQMRWDPDNPVQKKNFDNFVSNLVVGDMMASKAFSSTTSSKKMATEISNMARRGEMTASLTYETTGVYLNGESKYPDQEEILLERDVEYEIVSVSSNKNKDHYNIKLREVV